MVHTEIKTGITFTFEAEGEAECSLLLYEKGQEITERSQFQPRTAGVRCARFALGKSRKRSSGTIIESMGKL